MRLRSDRRQIVAAARSHVGKPFSIACRDGRATDCGGLVIDVAQACGYRWADLPHKYGLATSAGLTLYVHLRGVCNEIDPKEVEPGDLLLFWVRLRYHPQHLGILCGDTIVHASPMGARRVSERKLGVLKDKVYAAFRYRARAKPPQHTVGLSKHVHCERCVLADPVKYSRPVRSFSCAGC